MKTPMNVKTLTEGIVVRKNVEDHMVSRIGGRSQHVALLLSAGIDSVLAGLAANSVGHTVHAYTFQLGETQSFDSKWAESTAQIMNWEWTLVKLPNSIRQVCRDFPQLWDLGCRKKRDFECAWPFLYVYPQIRQRWVVNGLSAGAHFGLTRFESKLNVTKDKRAFDKVRRDYFSKFHADGYASVGADYNPSCLWQHLQIQRIFGLRDVNPYRSIAMCNHMLQFNWSELNQPRRKQFFAAAYPKLIARIGHRGPVGYQTAAGIGDFFEKLLRTPINFRGRKRTLDMFADYWRHEQEAERVMQSLRKSMGDKVTDLRAIASDRRTR